MQFEFCFDDGHCSEVVPFTLYLKQVRNDSYHSLVCLCFIHVLVKVMRLHNFHSMTFPQIWYKDSFRVADMNFNKKVGVTESD